MPVSSNPGRTTRIFPPSMILIAGVFVVVLVFLFTSRMVYHSGFPLDDAWIHQTYARNLGENGEWAFLPGQPSAGSTSPLWTVLLAFGYLLHLPYLTWTFFLGSLTLLGVAWLGEALLNDYLPGPARRIPWAGLFLIGEWHMAWAALSGMETLLNAILVMLVLWRAGRARREGWAWIGGLIGLGVWIRPDAVTLLGPAGLILLLNEGSWKQRLMGFGWFAVGFALMFGPYLVFNLRVQGSLWPNTFYAKQAEYAALSQTPLVLRYWNELKLPLIGAGIFLLPGFAAMVARAVKEKGWTIIAGTIWLLGYALIYAWRLPVTYQYGRYVMPAMPVFFVIGIAGSLLLVKRAWRFRAAWLVARVGILSAAFVWLAFLGIGANRYGQDVAIIETEMVDTARWIALNTSEDAVIAAHDIGAAGYFCNRRLVDLAGLISPEVIPFISNEARLATFLNEEQVDFLVVFDGWYAELPKGKTEVYRSKGKFSLDSGGSNMIIYQWREK